MAENSKRDNKDKKTKLKSETKTEKTIETKTKKKNIDFGRIFVSILYLALVIFVILSKNILIVTSFVGLISIFSIFEYFKAIDLDKSIFKYLAVIFGILIFSTYMFGSIKILKEEDFSLNLVFKIIEIEFILLIFLSMISLILKHEKYNVKELSLSIFGYIYTIVLPFYLLKIYNINENYGYIYLIYVFIITMITDSFAYLVGKYFGKRKLTKISPSKTIEGSVGGTVFALIFVYLLYELIFKKLGIDENTIPNVLNVLSITVILSILAQFGDLFASIIKRNFNKKDFSNILKDHGGILDRVDSIIFIAPIAFYVIDNFLKIS